MSASPWIKESGTGRYYMNWKNEYGEIERRYSEELSGGHSANQPSHSRDDYKTPRSESSTRVAERADYESTTPRYTTSQQPRRESISFSRTAEPPTDHAGRSEPLMIYDESRTGYHRAGGYDPPRDVRVRERADRHDSPPLSESSQTTRRYQATGRTHERDADVLHDEVDDLSLGVGKVTVDDLVGSPRYTTVSASAPARSGQWGHVAPRREATRVPIYEEDRGPEREREREREPAFRSPVSENLSDEYRDKGKTIVPNSPETLSVDPAGKRHISGTDGQVEPLDDSYKVRNYDWQKFFRPGRVFSTLWTDAFAGTTNESENNQFMSSVTYVIYKERVHSKIRRFVVVRQGDRCCTCLPVTTYDGRGSRKRGINLNEHGLIFSSEKKPPNVKGIDKLPLRVRLSKGADRLNNPSLINYGRVYTVETNVKVKDVGELDSESRKCLRMYYNAINTLRDDDDDDGPGPARTLEARAVELAGVGSGIGGPSFSGISAPMGPVNPMRSTYGVPQDRSSSYSQYPTPQWTATSAQHPPTQPPHTAYSLYNPMGSTAPTTGRYPAVHTYDINRAPSNYQPTDSRYVQGPSTIPSHSTYPSALDSYPRPDARQTYGVPATQSYSSGTLPAGSGTYLRRDFVNPGDERSPMPPIDDRRPPLDHRSNRDSYGSNTTPMDRQPSWTPSQAPLSRPEPAGFDDRYNDFQYPDGNIDLPTLAEARESRQRRESVSDRSKGRDKDERGDRHRRKR